MKKFIMSVALIAAGLMVINAETTNESSTNNSPASTESTYSNDWQYYTTVSSIHKRNISNSGPNGRGFEVQRNSDGEMRISIHGNWLAVRPNNTGEMTKYSYTAGEWYFNL